MKNKLILSILAVVGLAAGASQAQSLPPVTFVDVATLGDGVDVATSSGTTKVNATVLTKNQRWTRDRVYILANNVIVPNNITLTIEPGTLVRAERNSRAQGTGGDKALTPADPGALVVARGGKLIAAGTSDAPIIFTSIDDVNVPGGAATVPPFENKGVTADGVIIINGERVLRTGYATPSGVAGTAQYTISGGTLNTAAGGAKNYSTTWAAAADSAFSHDALWGGIVLCGKTTVVRGYASGENARTSSINEPTINTSTGALTGDQKGVQLVEGMAGFPLYSWGGGDAELDDSGTLRFISNRYGGYIIALNTELNAFSGYGVGRNTTMEFLEAINNADDDFEFWGGDVNVRYSLSTFCGDDGLDTDQGYIGVVQYFVQLQNNHIGTDGVSVTTRDSKNVGDSLTENDGPESNNSAVPYSTYTLANATLIGRGYGTASYSSSANFTGPNFKDNAGCRTYNSLIMDNPQGAVLIMDSVTSVSDNSFSSAGNSSINRYAGTRGSGGFDGAGRASDLVTADNGSAGGPDGLYNNTWFFRNGYADSTRVGVNGVFATKVLFDAAVNNLPATSAANRFPDSTDRSGRGASADATTCRANSAAVQAEINKASNYNVFDSNPGVTVSPYHRISGMDLRVTADAAKNLGNSALPSYRGLNNDASFVGAVRDNMWMRGWTLGDRLGIYSGTQIVPDVVVSVVGSTPSITFGGEAGVKYVVEVSTDNKTYTKVRTVTATAGNNTVTDSLNTVGSSPLYYRVIAL
jgi:hypothetical protein